MGENGDLEEEDAGLRKPRLNFPRVSEGFISWAFPPTDTGYLQLTPAGVHFLAAAFKDSRPHVGAPLFWEPSLAGLAAGFFFCAADCNKRRVSASGIAGAPAAFGAPKDITQHESVSVWQQQGRHPISALPFGDGSPALHNVAGHNGAVERRRTAYRNRPDETAAARAAGGGSQGRHVARRALDFAEAPTTYCPLRGVARKNPTGGRDSANKMKPSSTRGSREYDPRNPKLFEFIPM